MSKRTETILMTILCVILAVCLFSLNRLADEFYSLPFKIEAKQ